MGSLPKDCAQAPIGHAAAAPPSTPRISRRLISAPGLKVGIIPAQMIGFLGGWRGQCRSWINSRRVGKAR